MSDLQSTPSWLPREWPTMTQTHAYENRTPPIRIRYTCVMRRFNKIESGENNFVDSVTDQQAHSRLCWRTIGAKHDERERERAAKYPSTFARFLSNIVFLVTLFKFAHYIWSNVCFTLPIVANGLSPLRSTWNGHAWVALEEVSNSIEVDTWVCSVQLCCKCKAQKAMQTP